MGNLISFMKEIDEANVTVISSLRKTFLSSKFLN